MERKKLGKVNKIEMLVFWEASITCEAAQALLHALKDYSSHLILLFHISNNIDMSNPLNLYDEPLKNPYLHVGFKNGPHLSGSVMVIRDPENPHMRFPLTVQMDEIKKH